MNPNAGRGGYIKLMGQELRFKEGSYVREEVPSIVEKANVGASKYADLSAHVSSFAASSWHLGYGLDRYSDSDLAGNGGGYLPNAEYPTVAAPLSKETSNVDTGNAGVAVLSPRQHDEVLEGADGPVVWIGEFGDDLYAIGGTKLYQRQATGGFSLKATLPAAPVKGAVGVFGAHLIIGYGSARTAQYTDDPGADPVVLADVTNGAGGAIYVFAFTSDKPGAYVAGGVAASDFNRVVSSVDGIAYSGTAVVCGPSHSRITGLAPGGGIGILYVGKETELGEIDGTPAYRVLVPFDSKKATNCHNLRWWLATTTDAQRGPLTVVFNRDDELWSFQPSSQDSGSAENMTPWSTPICNPPNIRGIVTASQGSARWLYFAVKNASGKSWILKRDGRTGAAHPFLDLGEASCDTMTVTSLYTYPMLFFAKGSNASYVRLDDSADYAVLGDLDLPGMDFLLPAENKTAFKVLVVADDVVAGQQYIEIYASLDGAAYAKLGTASAQPLSVIKFATNTVVRRIDLRVRLITADTSLTPRLRAVIVKASVNPEVYSAWTMALIPPQGVTALGSTDVRSPKALVADLWQAREDNLPVEFIDRWGISYMVQIKKLKERETIREPGRVPETELDVLLMEIEPGSGTVVWGDPLFIWGAPSSLWG